MHFICNGEFKLITVVYKQVIVEPIYFESAQEATSTALDNGPTSNDSKDLEQ